MYPLFILLATFSFTHAMPCGPAMAEIPATQKQVRQDALTYITHVYDSTTTPAHAETRELLHSYALGKPEALEKGEEMMRVLARVLDRAVTPLQPMTDMPYDLLYRLANMGLSGEAYLQRAKDKARGVLRRIQPFNEAAWIADFADLVKGKPSSEPALIESRFAASLASSVRPVDPKLIAAFAERPLSPALSRQGVPLQVQGMHDIAQELSR